MNLGGLRAINDRAVERHGRPPEPSRMAKAGCLRGLLRATCLVNVSAESFTNALRSLTVVEYRG